MDTQMSLFDIAPSEMEKATGGRLNVVKADYKESVKVGWHELFEGFDELYGITYSSGIQFSEKLFDSFEHVEMIFGCEGVLSDDLSTIISAQIKSVEEIVKSKSAKRIAERMKEGSIDICVSRDTRSHEKIFIMRAKDGRVRVVCGSANMSASAFLGIQRENIVCFDDKDAFDYYKILFDDFKEKCSDSVSEKLLVALDEDEDYVRDNIQETPIIKTIKKKNVVILEPSAGTDEAEIVADVKGLEAEIKPLLPKVKPENGKVFVTGETTRAFKRKYDENANVKKVREKKLPKLHIDYDAKKICFNGKDLNMHPSEEMIRKDISCLTSFIDSLSCFHGIMKRARRIIMGL